MSCQIRDGKYYAPNGEESKLYNDLKEKVGEVQAKDLFVLAYTPQFLKERQGVKNFYENGEIRAERILKYATSLNESAEELSFVEQQEVRSMLTEFPGIADSEELSERLTKAFYKDGMFAPTIETLKELYSNYEIDSILTDVALLSQVKESIEKLKRTPLIENTTALEATYKVNEVNILGKLKTDNPFKISQDIVEEFGGVENPDLSEIKDKTITEEYLKQFKRVPTIDENGIPVFEEIIYTEAVKVVEDQKIFDAITAIENAPQTVDTSKVEQKLSKWLLNYGVDIQGFTRDLVPSLKSFLSSPTTENIKNFSDKYREVFNKPEKIRERVLKIERQDRNLVYLETNKTEQELFDEVNLLQTETANVYHKIERVDFQEMKDALQLDKNITELQAYKDYFNYNTTPIVETHRFVPVMFKNSIEYLTGEFIADFNIEKLKNPESNFYNKFKITEKGIEQIYKDSVSTAEIQAYIADDVKLGKELQEYSILSKQMNNLVENTIQLIRNKEINRIFAVNNFEQVKLPQGDFTKLNKETLIVKNSIEEFLNNENEIFELVGKEGNNSIYNRIEKNNSLNYNEMSPKAPTQLVIPVSSITQTPDKYSDISKMWRPSEIGDNFDCL